MSLICCIQHPRPFSSHVVRLFWAQIALIITEKSKFLSGALLYSGRKVILHSPSGTDCIYLTVQIPLSVCGCMCVLSLFEWDRSNPVFRGGSDLLSVWLSALSIY